MSADTPERRRGCILLSVASRRFLFAIVSLAAVLPGEVVRADHLRAGGILENLCGGTCTEGSGSVEFTWMPNNCNPTCTVTPDSDIVNECSAVTAIELHKMAGSDPCVLNDSSPFPIDLQAGSFTLTLAQLNHLLAGDYVVWVERGVPEETWQQVVNKYVVPEFVPTVSEWGLAAMTLLGLTAGTIVFMRRRVAAV